MNLPSEPGHPYYVPEALREGTIELTGSISMRALAIGLLSRDPVAAKAEQVLNDNQSFFTPEQVQKFRDDINAANTGADVLSAWGLNMRDCALANSWQEPTANT